MATQRETTKKKASADAAKAAARAERLRLLGHILRVSRGDMTQETLAELVSTIRGERTIQTSISRWEHGEVDMSVEMLRDIEQALGLERGSILISAGYVAPSDVSIPALLRADPTIHENFRADIERVYKSYQEMSRQLKEAETTAGRRRAVAR